MQNLILSERTYLSLRSYLKISTTTFESYEEGLDYAYLAYDLKGNLPNKNETLHEIISNIIYNAPPSAVFISEEESKLSDIYDNNLSAYAEEEWYIPNRKDPDVRKMVEFIMSDTYADIYSNTEIGYSPVPKGEKALDYIYKDAFVTTQVNKFLSISPCSSSPSSVSDYLDFEYIRKEIMPHILFAILADYLTIKSTASYCISYDYTEIEQELLDNIMVLIRDLLENKMVFAYPLQITDKTTCEEIIECLLNYIDVETLDVTYQVKDF